MKGGIKLLVFFLSLGTIVIFKFLLLQSYGWPEFFACLAALLGLILSAIAAARRIKDKLLSAFSAVILVAFVLWFTGLGVDYKQHRNIREPILALPGYRVETQFTTDTETGVIKRSGSCFYLFGAKIHEVFAR